MTVWDLIRSYKKFEQVQEKRARCYEVLLPAQCQEQELALARAFADTEAIFDNLVAERIGEFLAEQAGAGEETAADA
jgi:hypothetical protein